MLSAVVVASFVIAAYTLADQHDTAAKQRVETRNAIVLLGRAICGQSAVFESAALDSAKTAAQRARIIAVFAKYNAPVDAALINLGAKPCPSKGARP